MHKKHSSTANTFANFQGCIFFFALWLLPLIVLLIQPYFPAYPRYDAHWGILRQGYRPIASKSAPPSVSCPPGDVMRT